MVKEFNNRESPVTIALEILVIVVIAYFFAGQLINTDPNTLPQGGEENQSSVRPILTATSLKKYNEIPLWNHYMEKGMPFTGDLYSHFWSPVTTIPVWIWGGIVGMKISLFLSFLIAGLGQWYFSKILGLKGVFRLWSAILFMCSGGLALLMRLGWYELLLGIAWFPAAFASFWQALSKKGALPIIWAAFCSTMILFTGGGYYPFYLLGCMVVILIAALILIKRDKKTIVLRSAIIAAVLFGYIAVMTFPIYDGFRLVTRDIGIDMEQRSSQPIPYALFNYVVSTPEWFGTSVLDLANGFTWYFIGPIVLVAWIFLPIALRRRRRTPFFITVIFLFLFVLSWHSNKFTFFKYIYGWIPFLYNLRFPGRLLIVASSPLIAVSAFMLQSGFSFLRSKFSKNLLGLRAGETEYKINTRLAFKLISIIVLLSSAYTTYTVNKMMAFFPLTHLEPHAYQVMRLIKSQDSGAFYTQFGEETYPYWNYISVAMLYEIPVINARYGTLLNSVAVQSPNDPIVARPKYIVVSMQAAPANGKFLKEYEGIGVWEMPDALPMAFTTSQDNIDNGVKLTNGNVSPLEMHYDGPNRIIVKGSTDRAGSPLVLLVSDYPGWKVSIDGQSQQITAINGYMSTPMLVGYHTYTFVFDPVLYKLGLVVTLLTILASFVFVIRESNLPFRKLLPWQK